MITEPSCLFSPPLGFCRSCSFPLHRQIALLLKLVPQRPKDPRHKLSGNFLSESGGGEGMWVRWVCVCECLSVYMPWARYVIHLQQVRTVQRWTPCKYDTFWPRPQIPHTLTNTPLHLLLFGPQPPGTTTTTTTSSYAPSLYQLSFFWRGREKKTVQDFKWNQENQGWNLSFRAASFGRISTFAKRLLPCQLLTWTGHGEYPSTSCTDIYSLRI